MARNRKSQSAAIRFGPALKALLLCLFDWRFGRRIALAEGADRPAERLQIRQQEAGSKSPLK